MIQRPNPLESLGLLPKWLRDDTPDPQDLPVILVEELDPETFWTLEGVSRHVCTN